MTKMANAQAVLVLCILLVAVCCTIAIKCVPAEGYESCACYMEGVNNTREYVNLLPLKGNSSNPRFTTVGEKGWYYLYSPCAKFNEFVGENETGYLPCVNASVARMTNLSTHRCDSLGDKASATFKSASITGLIKSNLTLNFMSSGAEHYSAVISLVCDDSVAKNKSILEYVGNETNPAVIYYLSLTSKCCCPGKCGIPPVPLVPLNSTTPTAPITPTAAKQTGDKGLKTWQIIVIAAGSALLVLLIVGLVCCCCRRRGGYQTI